MCSMCMQGWPSVASLLSVVLPAAATTAQRACGIMHVRSLACRRSLSMLLFRLL